MTLPSPPPWLVLTSSCLLVSLLTLSLPRSQPFTRPTYSLHYLDISDLAASSSHFIRGNVTQQCSPVQRVGFAKTHKTASSTVQNILLRWGLHSSWQFALYKSGSHLGRPASQYVLTEPFQVWGCLQSTS